MEQLKHWVTFLEELLPQARVGFVQALVEDRFRSGKAPRWVHWVALPDGANEFTPLGLLCEPRGYVFPVGSATMHQRHPDNTGFWVFESNGWSMGPLELHSKSCTCTLKVVEFQILKERTG